MEASKLYTQLEKDFINPSLWDDWAEKMKPLDSFLSDNYKKRSIGVVCDNSKDIHKVYTAVFPSDAVMQFILSANETGVLLFVHHPMIWDIRTAPEIFKQMDKGLLEQFRKKKISIYNLHAPLDNYGDYSTSVTLAKALGMVPDRPFAPYNGGLCGVFCRATTKTASLLKTELESAIGHRASLYVYGTDKISNSIVAVIAGGGNDVAMLGEVSKEGVNTFVTGVTVLNSHSQKAHAYAKKHKINLIGGTHYPTEKFACIAMCEYFRQLGLKSEFIEDKPILEDL